jgi:hypothetical protein
MFQLGLAFSGSLAELGQAKAATDEYTDGLAQTVSFFFGQWEQLQLL